MKTYKVLHESKGLHLYEFRMFEKSGIIEVWKSKMIVTPDDVDYYNDEGGWPFVGEYLTHVYTMKNFDSQWSCNCPHGLFRKSACWHRREILIIKQQPSDTTDWGETLEEAMKLNIKNQHEEK
jgi:hypothetical protein